MRALIQKEIDLIQRLSRIPRVQIGLFEVTSTQLEKSIIDGTYAMRSSLARTGFHDYATQQLGVAHKVLKKMFVISGGQFRPTTMSLYRPESKQGDPRFWISGLRNLMPEIRPEQIVAVLQDGTTAVAVNISAPQQPPEVLVALVADTFRDQQSASPVVPTAYEELSIHPELPSTDHREANAERLLAEFLRLKLKGPLPAMRTGPTAIGHAVETALGIDQNSSKDPDKYGIEIKSTRAQARTRVNLFAQVANWNISEIKSSAALLAEYGYIDTEGVPALRCTVSSQAANSQGLYFEVDFDNSLLLEVATTPGGDVPVLTWELDELGRRLSTKHSQTFWIDAEPVTVGGRTHFELTRLVYTRSPNLMALGMMLADGTITMDHLISNRPGRGVTEKGPLFKIWPKDIPRLFTVEAEFDLSQLSQESTSQIISPTA